MYYITGNQKGTPIWIKEDRQSEDAKNKDKEGF